MFQTVIQGNRGSRKTHKILVFLEEDLEVRLCEKRAGPKSIEIGGVVEKAVIKCCRDPVHMFKIKGEGTVYQCKKCRRQYWFGQFCDPGKTVIYYH